MPFTRIAEAAARLAPTSRYPALLTTVGEFGRHSFVTIDRAREELGYAPVRSLFEGIVEALQESNPAG